MSLVAGKPKVPGETKVVAIMGDYFHNAAAQEICIRRIYATAENWRIIFVLANQFFTPELISDADLFIAARLSGPDTIGWRTEGLAEELTEGDDFWTDEHIKAVVDNVSERGMGFMALHCTIACENEALLDFMDTGYIPHQAKQDLWLHNLNQEHPITQGFEDFRISLDEQFGASLKSDSSTALFEMTGVQDRRETIGGWCLERGAGRVVGLLPGHLHYAYSGPAYQEIMWRAAHWAMGRNIPLFPGVSIGRWP